MYAAARVGRRPGRRLEQAPEHRGDVGRDGVLQRHDVDVAPAGVSIAAMMRPMRRTFSA